MTAETVAQIFADLFGLEDGDLTDDLQQEDVDLWDSLNHLRLVTALEEEFGISLSMAEIESIASFNDVQQVVSRHLNGG